jgi:hypothetical protein
MNDKEKMALTRAYGKDLDWSVEGYRVRLISTTDPLTSLKPGAFGTVSFKLDGILYVSWDDGSKLSLIEGIDEWEFVEKEQ